MDTPSNLVAKLTGKADLEAKVKELEQKIEIKDMERDAWVSAVEGLKIQLGNALEEIKKLKQMDEEKVTEQRSDNQQAQAQVSPHRRPQPQPQVMNTRVRVGVGVFILQSFPRCNPENPVFIIGRRKGSHGAGTLALPGGHLEFGESVEECAKREALEETGLEVSEPVFLTVTNDVMIEEGKHYITVFVCCSRIDETAEAQVLEAEKCEGWDRATWAELKSWVREERKMFLPLVNLVKQRVGVVPRIS